MTGTRDTRRGLIVVGLLAVSAFGPYVTSGVRAGQIAVYGFTVLLLPFLWTRVRFTGAVAVMLVSWLLFILVVTVVWATGGVSSAWGSSGAAANLDNVLLPVMVVLIVLATVDQLSRDLALQRAAMLTTIGMCVNTAIGLTQFVFPAPIQRLSLFWGGGGTTERALTLQRYTGLIGQPSVAGVLYSVAGVCAVYALRNHRGWRLLVVAILALGGILTLSKAFLLGGLPVMLWLLLTDVRSVGHRVRIVLACVSMVVLAGASGLFDTWRGVERVTYFLPGGGASLNDYLGNRYSSGSESIQLLQEVWERAPLSGYGLGGVDVATDSALVYAMVLGGMLGVGAVLATLATPLEAYRQRRHSIPRSERRLLGGLALVVFLGAIGAPDLVSNRASLVIWMLFTLLLGWHSQRAHIDDSESLAVSGSHSSVRRPRHRSLDPRAQPAPISTDRFSV